MKTPLKIYIIVLLLSFINIVNVHSQANKQQELEERRLALKAEIKKINSLLFKNQSKAKTQTTLIEDLNYKINVRENLIKVTNQQANLLTREITNNQKQISQLRSDLKTLKHNYAEMVVTSYKSKNQQSRLMFLLSSNNFKQAYKRFQYMKQFTNYQKEQGVLIKTKALELQERNLKLSKQKKEKDVLIVQNKAAKKELLKERKTHEELMASIKENLNAYTAQIKAKQREIAKVDGEIQNIIAQAIANSNKKAGKAPSSIFALTAEAKALETSFIKNKGKLPWPVEKGLVKVRYGKQPHPVVKTVTIQSNGVRIATETNANVRAVFEGTVLRILTTKRGNLTVLIQHGNYITAYKNLAKVTVKKGEKVSTKETIGSVFTNPTTKEATLSFVIFKTADKTVNPAHWIYKM